MARIKRFEVPGFWPIEKKTKLYTVATKPGPHSRKMSITLAVILRDMLQCAENLREVKQILNSRSVRVNNIIRKEAGFPVGIMDLVSLGEENYRMLPHRNGFLLKRVNEKESAITLKKIINKTTARNKKMQLHFHDGSVVMAEGKYATGDVVVFDIKERKIRDVIRQEKDASVLIIKGNNRGVIGKVENIKIVKSPEPNIAEISAGDRRIILPLDYIFAVGGKEPVISLGEENE